MPGAPGGADAGQVLELELAEVALEEGPERDAGGPC